MCAADAEITLETNPETVTDARMEGWRRAGVNRISFGAQSFDDAELQRLERVHTAARVGEAVGMARAGRLREREPRPHVLVTRPVP